MLRTYSFATPSTWGFGTLAAATAAVIADLEPWSFYELNGLPMTTPEVVGRLNDRVAHELFGLEVEGIHFSRSFNAASDDEFRIRVSEPESGVA